MINNQSAIITGITGQDGAYLAQFLLQKGYKVFGIVRNTANISLENFIKIGVDTSKISFHTLSEIPEIIEDTSEVYNLAGQSSVGESWKIPLETFQANVDSYITLLSFCKGKKVKVLQACSGDMYGIHDTPLQEDLPMNPTSPYALSKYTSYLYGKLIRETEKLWITNAILFNHESILRDDRFVIRKIINSAKDIKAGTKEFIELGNVNVKRDWGFAPDYVEAMWKLLQLERAVDCNVATGSTLSLKEFIALILQKTGIEGAVDQYIKSNPQFIRPNDPEKIEVDTTFLNSLGIKLTPFSKTNIHRLID